MSTKVVIKYKGEKYETTKSILSKMLKIKENKLTKEEFDKYHEDLLPWFHKRNVAYTKNQNKFFSERFHEGIPDLKASSNSLQTYLKYFKYDDRLSEKEWSKLLMIQLKKSTTWSKITQDDFINFIKS